MRNPSLVSNFSHTIKLFHDYIYDFMNSYLIQENNKKIKKYGCCLFGYFLTTKMLSVYYPFVGIYNNTILFSTYWFLLGILSTIGFGFGLQTGVLFLFPYLINSYDETQQYALMKCYFLCLPAVVLWGIGSAFGELPPFFVTKFNILSDERNSKNVFLKSLENKLIYKKLASCLKKYKFITIVLFSSWPNITFDMCGMLCGYYNFELHEFLVPTIIGKGFIKAPIQSFVVLYVYSNNISYNFRKNNSGIIMAWNIFIISLILLFIKSTIENIAILQQKKIEKRNANYGKIKII